MADQPSVFLCHNSDDKEAVRTINRCLEERGVRTWLDSTNLVSGKPLIAEIERALFQCGAAAIFLGPSGASFWQQLEIDAILNTPSIHGKPTIPVFLPGYQPDPKPTLLLNFIPVVFTSVDEGDSQFEPALEKLIAGIAAGARAAQVETTERPRFNPYRSLQFFDVKDAKVFAGRSAEIEASLKILSERDGIRFLMLVGPSGSGKSSLARAGVLARYLEEHKGARYAVVIPGARPLEQLALQVIRAGGHEPTGDEIATAATRYVDDAHKLRRDILAFDETRPLVLVVDQAEQAFAFHAQQQNAPGGKAIKEEADAGDRQRAAFFDNIVNAACERGGNASVIMTLRSDFLDECAQYSVKNLVTRMVLVGPMDRDNLRRAIEAPAREAGFQIEPALVNQLLDDWSDEKSSLPLLQFVLWKLWQSEGASGVLTLAGYMKFGKTALNDHADGVYKGSVIDGVQKGLQTEAQRAIADRVFLRLVQPYGQSRFTKRSKLLHELLPAEATKEDTAALEEVVAILAGSEGRLLTIWQSSGSDAPHDAVVDLSHEVLLSCWTHLERLLNDNRRFLLWKDRLQIGLSEYRRHKGRQGTFLEGVLLQEAEGWLSEKPAEHSPEEKAYIKASQNHRRLSLFARVGVALVALGSIAALWGANWLKQKSDREMLLTTTQKLVIGEHACAPAAAQLAAEKYPGAETTALLIEAVQARSNPVVHITEDIADLRFLHQSDRLVVGARGDVPYIKICDSGVSGLCDEYPAAGALINHVAVSPDDSMLFAGAENGVLTAWDIDKSGKLSNTRTFQTSSRSTAIAAGRQFAIVAVTEESKAKLYRWRPSDNKLEPLIQVPAEIQDLTIHPGGSVVAGAGLDQQLHLITLGASPTIESIPSGHVLRRVSYSADGSRLFTVDMLGGASIWDVSGTIKRAGRYEPPTLVTMGGSDSTASRVVALSGNRKLVSLWNASTGAEEFSFPVRDDTVTNMAVSADGLRVALAVKGEGIRIHDLSLKGLRERVTAALRIPKDELEPCSRYLSKQAMADLLGPERK